MFNDFFYKGTKTYNHLHNNTELSIIQVANPIPLGKSDSILNNKGGRIINGVHFGSMMIGELTSTLISPDIEVFSTTKYLWSLSMWGPMMNGIWFMYLIWGPHMTSHSKSFPLLAFIVWSSSEMVFLANSCIRVEVRDCVLCLFEVNLRLGVQQLEVIRVLRSYLTLALTSALVCSTIYVISQL